MFRTLALYAFAALTSLAGVVTMVATGLAFADGQVGATLILAGLALGLGRVLLATARALRGDEEL